MIGYLSGVVIDRGQQHLLLDVSGVGYVVWVPTTLAASANLNEPLAVYTHLSVREDALTLFGFDDSDSRSLFELLIDVSGVGPKIALNVLSAYSPPQIRQAVASGNTAAFSAVSGIGKKNAERIVLELKNRVGPVGVEDAIGGSDELHQALLALGYSQAEVLEMSQSVSGELPLSEQVKAALKK